MKVYTKTGDGGETSLFTGERVPKSQSHVEAYGTVDECNSHIGVVLAFMQKEENSEEEKRVMSQLHKIQCWLFDVGAHLATPLSSCTAEQKERTAMPEGMCEVLEGWIDEWEKTLPKLTNFILPGGSLAGAQLHVCRTVARRAERLVVGVVQNGDAGPEVGAFMNRLSDYFFVLSRSVNALHGAPENVWKKTPVTST